MRINIRKISYDYAFSMINGWLMKCNELRDLDSNFDYRIKLALYHHEKTNVVYETGHRGEQE